MTDTLQISTGEKHIPVVRDGAPVGEIVFNPSDVVFAEKFYKVLGEIEAKTSEYQRQIETLDAANEKDGDDIPLNMGDRLALLRSICEYNNSLIDSVFGAGTAKTVFGDALNLDVFQQFFDGVALYFKQARAEKLKQYIVDDAKIRRTRALKTLEPKKPQNRRKPKAK